MYVVAHIVMAVWIPTVLVLFAVLPPRRAVIVSFLAAWLFLPMVTYPLPFVPDYSKMSATCAGVFMSTFIFDAKRILRFLPSWVDLPMLVFCLCPMISSLTNGLGIWDGTSGALSNVITWGLPYLIGRLYFTDARGLRELAVGIFIGGLLYLPLCLFEMRMSPKLHHLVYGFFARGVQMRYGGWRPAVFLDGGLELGMWMTGATLIAIWLWKAGSLKALWGISATGLLIPLVITTIMCRATGALVLLALGIAVMWACSVMKNRLALVCFLAIVPAYLCLRATDVWHGEPIVSMAKWVSSDRAASLTFRLDNEDMLAARAAEQPWFGWGGWNRGRVRNEWGEFISITDGLWIIEFGQHGAIGLASCFMAMLMPLALLVRRFSARRLCSAELAPALSLGVLVTLYAIDCLPNAMVNPVYMLAGGAVVSFALASQSARESVKQDESSRTGSTILADSIPPRRPFPVRA